MSGRITPKLPLSLQHPVPMSPWPVQTHEEQRNVRLAQCRDSVNDVELASGRLQASDHKLNTMGFPSHHLPSPLYIYKAWLQRLLDLQIIHPSSSFFAVSSLLCT